MEIKYLKTKDLIHYARNNKIHDKRQIKAIASSIKEFGFKQPIVVDSENVIIAGHGRVLASEKLKLEKIPCIIADDLSSEQIRAYRIADNKSNSLSEWNNEMLGLELEDLLGKIDFETIGFDVDEAQELINVLESDLENDVKEDEVPEVDETKEPYSKLGDIWLLGKHKLMCGDSITDCDKLMNNQKAHMCFTDPPYNINYGNIKYEKFKQREIKNDNMSKEEFNKFCEGYTNSIKNNVLGCVYIAGPPGPDGRIMFTVADNILHCSTTIVWNKDQFTLGRGKYQNKYEPIWFGWVENGTRFTKDRKLVNVWDIPRPKKSELHPTMKPIELVKKAINEASLKSDIVLDLFGGSGTTLIASEITGRIAYLMELDEKYIDVIVKRYHNLGKEDIKLIRGNKEYNWKEIKNEFLK